VELYQDLKCAAPSSSGSPEKVNAICDALRAVLEKRDLLKYTETILTTHVCKIPADYESGLKVLLHLQSEAYNTTLQRSGSSRAEEHPEVVEDAVKYIIFLSDVNQLYDVALGMYDFQLVLMVAQYSQKVSYVWFPVVSS
jgi:elongator complex protein 1